RMSRSKSGGGAGSAVVPVSAFRRENRTKLKERKSRRVICYPASPSIRPGTAAGSRGGSPSLQRRLRAVEILFALGSEGIPLLPERNRSRAEGDTCIEAFRDQPDGGCACFVVL